MKAFITFLLLAWSLHTLAQPVIADPALGQVIIANISNENVPDNPPVLPIQVVYILKLPIQNLSLVNTIPTGSAKVKIGLGSRIILNPSFNLATANTSAYFNWTLFDNDGQFELTGDGFGLLPLPPGYNDTATFLIKGFLLGSSTISANFLVTNHNTSVPLSDNNGSNNLTSQFYLITQPLPVTFTGLYLKKENCGIAVNFTSENEINLHHYEVEYSSNGVNFQKAGKVATNSLRNYKYKLNVPASLSTGSVYVRIKSVDNDGKFQYSEIKMLKNLCDEKANIFLYPNPVSGSESFVTIANKAGRFANGKYTISLLDFSGKLLNNMQQSLLNVSNFKYNIANLAAGNYLLKLTAEFSNSAPVVLTFQKLN